MKELDLNVNGINVSAFVSENNGQQFIALKPLCDALGIKYENQREKINNNSQFSPVLLNPKNSVTPDMGGNSTTPHKGYGSTTPHKGGGSSSRDGKDREMLCIPIREVGMWICNINANKVKPEVRDKVLTFQKYLQEVIYQAVFNKIDPQAYFELVRGFNLMSQELARVTARLEEIEGRVSENSALQKVAVSNSARTMSAKRWNQRAPVVAK
jgi:hypothetical protein